jgi:metallo-beta-lactamase family protein
MDAGFYDAGHILGSSIIKVDVHLNGEKRTVLFAGDIGRPHRPIVRDPTIFEQADYVLVESTLWR